MTNFPFLRLVTGACLALAGTALTACGSSGADSKKDGESGAAAPIRVVYQPTTTSLPALVADAQGYFAKHGLTVKLTAASGAISAQIPALGQQYDLAMATNPDLIQAVSHGISVVEVTGGGVDSDASPIALTVARKDAGINSYADLDGKRVGSPSLSGDIHLAVLTSIRKASHDPGTTTFRQATVTALPDQLKAGQLDAIEAIQPFATILTAGGASVSLGDPYRAIGDNLTVQLWISKSDWASAHKTEVKAWRSALEDAATFIKSNPTEAKAILQKANGLDANAIKALPLPTYNFSQNQDQMDIWVRAMKDAGWLKESVDTTRLFAAS